MIQALEPLSFPLYGTRLIEASAGTGKTWTIAALYVRLVLGHGAEHGFARPLLPSEILVMTFTRAATRELSNRVRERLLEAAAYFRGQCGERRDPFLDQLLESYPFGSQREQAAHRLMLAAETMDEAAIFTIDAWCQRMLREHAFDSGSLFDEELVSDERELFNDAANDYWRQQVYPLNAAALAPLLACWPDVAALKQSVRALVQRAICVERPTDESLAALIARVQRDRHAQLSHLKSGWVERSDSMEQWISAQRDGAPKCFNGTKMKPDGLVKWFDGLRAWALDPPALMPQITATAWHRLTPDGISDAFTKGFGADIRIPACFEATADLKTALDALAPLAHDLLCHAGATIAHRMAQLKLRARQFGFADMIERLKASLQGENGDALRERITGQFPLAMVDEFQDTSPDQYLIFNLLYRVAENDPAHGLFLIGDPKQSIYGFRGADIHSYLAARHATVGRHYQLGTNFRSSQALVQAVNQLFLHAEGPGQGLGEGCSEGRADGHPGFAGGAFRFRRGDQNRLPFAAVAAQGRTQQLVAADGPCQALTVCYSDLDTMTAEDTRSFFAHHCAEHIVGLLNDPHAGFHGQDRFTRLQPADIAVLVRDRKEAAAIRRALQQRQVASVYLSDKDSVIESEEAADVLRWLQAIAAPLDGMLARAAFATGTAGLSLAALAQLASDEQAWEARVEQLKALHLVWQRNGVLAMLRRFIDQLQLPATLLQEAGGERRLTNLLHLAELLQSASRQLDGEQALIRWLAEQIAGDGEAGDERVLRLESDAELVKVVTVHKSKGLEYPLVFLPFAASARKVDRRNRSFFEYTDDAGVRQFDLSLSDEALQALERARIEEDLRLLYVAVTRACHFLWLGVATNTGKKKAGENSLHESALGYLLAGGEPIGQGQMAARWDSLRAGCGAIAIRTLDAPNGVTRLARVDTRAALVDPAIFSASFERDWAVSSFSSLARRVGPVAYQYQAALRAGEENLLEPDDKALPLTSDAAPWHRFPRGPVPGNFLHEQLEWMGQEGFERVHDAQFEARLAARCERAGWGHRQQDAIAWLRAVATTPLPPLDAALCEIESVLPEMEFWFPSERLRTRYLDQLCSLHLLDGAPRGALPERQLHGMLKGFADLVFERDGRYWVLDYKSNALGAGDAAYHRSALAAGMAEHRYDVQGAIYMLALHRLLKSRMGPSYLPQQHLGGAIFLFLRGIANQQTHGCYLLQADPALINGLDILLDEESELEDEHDE